MVATTNIANYGLSNVITLASGSLWNNSGYTRVYISSAAYTAITTAPGVIIVGSGNRYRCMRYLNNGSEAVGAGSANVWTGSGWIDGPGTNYYLELATARASGGVLQSGFYWAGYSALGSVKSITVSEKSEMDKIGIPGTGDTSTLVFDVDGVVTEISVEGLFEDSTATNLSGYITALEDYMTGTQYTSLPHVFWWDATLIDGLPVGYMCNVENITYKRNEKNVKTIEYSLKLAKRALSV